MGELISPMMEMEILYLGRFLDIETTTEIIQHVKLN